MPLLLDFKCAREAVPAMPLPQHPAYAGGAERAAWHVEEALRVFTRAFGSTPGGLLAVRRRDQCGDARAARCARAFSWVATQRRVLRGEPARSAILRRRPTRLAYNRPYRVAGTGLDCFFRDDTLSDLIGFTYATWHGDDAAQQSRATSSASSRGDYDGAPVTRC